MFSEKWHRRFMEMAFLVASWSKDPSTKTGAIVVGPDREIRATGYNGLVRGVDDNKPERMERPTKYTVERLCPICNACPLYRLRPGNYPIGNQNGCDQCCRTAP